MGKMPFFERLEWGKINLQKTMEIVSYKLFYLCLISLPKNTNGSFPFSQTLWGIKCLWNFQTTIKCYSIIYLQSIMGMHVYVGACLCLGMGLVLLSWFDILKSVIGKLFLKDQIANILGFVGHLLFLLFLLLLLLLCVLLLLLITI